MRPAFGPQAANEIMLGSEYTRTPVNAAKLRRRCEKQKDRDHRRDLRSPGYEPSRQPQPKLVRKLRQAGSHNQFRRRLYLWLEHRSGTTTSGDRANSLD